MLFVTQLDAQLSICSKRNESELNVRSLLSPLYVAKAMISVSIAVMVLV